VSRAWLAVVATLGACSESPARSSRGDGAPDAPAFLDLRGGERAAADLRVGEGGLLDRRAGDRATVQPDQLPTFTATYYVDSVGGKDGNPGTSPGAAWQTLAKVNGQTFKPGNAVFFKAGSTWTGLLSIKSSGTAAAPIVYSVYGGTPRPIIRNPGAAGSFTRCIDVSASYVIIEGLLLKEAHEAAVSLQSSSSHVVVRDIEATATGFGVNVSGQDNVVTRSYFHDLHIVNDTPGGDDDYGAVGVVLDHATSCEISYNKMVNCKDHSYDYGQDGGVVEWWAASSGNKVHHNWGENSEGFLEVGGQGDTVKDNLIAYNVSVNNNGFLTLHVGGTFGVNLQNFRVENNTVYEPDDDATKKWELIWFASTPPSGALVLRNNLFYAGGLDAISHQGGFTHENNLYWILPSGGQAGFTLGAGEKQADPLLVDPAKKDLHLKTGSPAINAGQSLGQTVDFDGKAVPCESAPEIGAFEHGC
jgi:hypothetical protein